MLSTQTNAKQATEYKLLIKQLKSRSEQ